MQYLCGNKSNIAGLTFQTRKHGGSLYHNRHFCCHSWVRAITNFRSRATEPAIRTTLKRELKHYRSMNNPCTGMRPPPLDDGSVMMATNAHRIDLGVACSKVSAIELLVSGRGSSSST